jgi:hypothetical protein
MMRLRIRSLALRRGEGYDVVVSGLTADQMTSLAARLTAAAIVAETTRGALRVRRSRNRVFRVAQIATVVREWLGEDARRRASLTLVGRRDERVTPRSRSAGSPACGRTSTDAFHVHTRV